MYYENKMGKVYYEVYGEKNEKTIVFCHGVSMNYETFNSQVDILKEKYKVIIWDMPYHGSSSSIENNFNFPKKKKHLKVLFQEIEAGVNLFLTVKVI